MVANSPGLIAGSNVLHRLLMPRHPPCALQSLSQQRQNNTRQNKPTPAHPPIKGTHQQHKKTYTARPVRKPATPIITTRQPTHTTHQPQHTWPTRRRSQDASSCKDARVHYADLKQQPHQPPTPATNPPPQGQTSTHGHRAKGGPEQPTSRLILQDPTVCLTPSPTNVRQRVTTTPHTHTDKLHKHEKRDRRRFH